MFKGPVVRLNIVVLYIRHEHAEGRELTGIVGYNNLRDVQLPGNLDRMKPAGSTKGNHHKVTRVISSFHGNTPDRERHIHNSDLGYSESRLNLGQSAFGANPVGNALTRLFRVEGHFSSEELCGAQPA